MTWFKTKNAVPREGMRVIIYPGRHGGEVSTGYCEGRASDPSVVLWIDDTEWIGEEGGYTYIEVTHWQHLPDAPLPERLEP